jgi:cellulose biosynthesis protein BcsQ
LKGVWVPHDTRDQIVDFVNRWSSKTGIAVLSFLLGIGLARSTWHHGKSRSGKANEHHAWVPRDHWLDEAEKRASVDFHERHPLEGYRRLTFMMVDAEVVAASPSRVYRLLKAAGLLERHNTKTSTKGRGFVPPLMPHEHGHVDVSYLNIAGTFDYLCSLLDRNKATLYDLLAAMLKDEFNPEQIRHCVLNPASNIGGGLRNFSVIPCSFRIDDFSTNWAKAKRGYHSNDEFLRLLDRRRKQLRRWLRENAYFTIIDCPPSLSLPVRFFLRIADGFVIPTVPDRLSVRGSLYLLHRLATSGFSKIKPIGTLWSLYREQNHVHRATIEKTRQATEPYSHLPRPFETLIPNATAIAHALDPEKKPASFCQKYTPQFARLYEQLCEEIQSRTARPEPALV